MVGAFHRWGIHKMDGLYIMENPMNFEDLGVPPLQETSIFERSPRENPGNGD
jgi:hypothetical protein